jgi:hypothetical protein
MRWLANLLLLLLSVPVRLLSRFARQCERVLTVLRFHLEFQPRPEDIFIATYAKSGTTWMQMILVQLVTGGRGEFGHISEVSPYLEDVVNRGRLRHLEGLPSPRLIKTHLTYEQLRPRRNPRIILVTRDVRDTFVSCHHHRQLDTRFRVDFEGFIESMVRGRGPFQDWFSYMRSWLPHRHDANVLWVRYEDLLAGLEPQVRRIAAFCGIPLEEERLGDILHRCGLAYMRQHDARFDFRRAMYEPVSGGFVGGAGERPRLREEHAAELARKVDQLRAELRLEDTERL